jgi:hypothetical protein
LNVRPAAFVAVLVLSACSDERASAVTSAASTVGEVRVVLRGTVLDAQSGEPVAGADVIAPDGSTTRSDSTGRFEFVDLPEELSGPLTATGEHGEVASNTLRPLRRGVLEVVLRLRAP